MTSFAIEGNKRHGKTLLAAYLAKRMAISVGNIPIYANFHIFGYDNFYYFTDLRQVLDVTNCILVWDEIASSGDSRKSSDDSIILLTHLFAQMEKRGITFIYTTQRSYLVDKRIRLQTDIVVECWKDMVSGLMYQTWWNTMRGRDHPKKIGKYIVSNPALAFKDFNTYEMVATQLKFN